MAAKLVAEEGLLKGLVLSLEEGEQWVIGRDPDACQLLIEDPSASRKHMICRTTPQGILVENLSTTNPVQINDVEVTKPQLLHNGDALKIGGGMFRFYAEAAANLFKDGDDDASAPVNGAVIASENTPVNNVPKEEKVEEEAPEEDKSQTEEPENGEILSEDEILREELKPDTAESNISTSSEQIINNPRSDEFKEPELKNDETESKGETNDALPESQPEPIQTENEALLNVSPLIEEPVEDEEVDIPNDSIFSEDPSEKDVIAEINFGLIDSGRWLLKVIGGPNNGAEFSMATDSSYVLGTDPNSCDIVFHDTSVSRQHARITITLDDTLTIEDLKSRNGTLVDGQTLKGKQAMPVNTLVSLGTTTFVVFDREGEMQTIISPLLPSIVKVLQKDEQEPATVAAAVPPSTEIKPLVETAALTDTVQIAPTKESSHPTATIGAFILIGILTGLFIIVGIGTTTLFKSEPVAVKEQVDTTKILDEILTPFSPGVKYTFNKGTGRLLLVGHVLTATDKNQLLYTLQGLKFIKNLDDSGIVIDEYVWHEINQVLEKNPNWRGISVQSPSAGHFVISGYLQTRAQAGRLDEYMSNNFPYIDLLEKRIVVDEDIVGSVNSLLDNMGFKSIKVKLDNGEITLSGKIPIGKSADVDSLLAEIKSLPGIRSVRNMLTEVAPDQSMINISDKYEVTGSSNQGGTHLNVVINGRILMKGDVLDGMTITSIQSNTILLEKEGIKYRIDFSK